MKQSTCKIMLRSALTVPYVQKSVEYKTQKICLELELRL